VRQAIRGLQMEARVFWRWATRASALGLALAIVGSYLPPPGRLRYASYIAIPVFIVLFIESRRRGHPGQEFKDTLWSM
jgi:hypothetical protein